MNKIKSLLRSENGVVLLGNVAASAIGLLSFMLLARSLTKSDFGEWALFISAAGLIDLMRTGLVRQGMVRAFNTADNESDKNTIIASSGFLSVGITVLSALVIATLGVLVDWSNWSMNLFFDYYPVLAVATLLWNFDTWVAHASGSYRRMNLLRLGVNGLFISFLLIGLLTPFSLEQYLWGYIGAQLLVSLVVVKHLSKYKWRMIRRKTVLSLLHFGKHSLATLAGSNLLKSADNLIIGAMMGTEAVAVFAIPMKVLDVMEIPLRGFVMTAYRNLTIKYKNNDLIEYKRLLKKNIGLLTLLCFPLAIVMLVFPAQVITIMGGENFNDSYQILQVLTIPLVLLPLDKFMGASFDSIGKPSLNATKVWIMVAVNILGDLLAIYYFQSIISVAIVTTINIALGIGFAWIKHPILTSPTHLLDSFFQKSKIKVQSAKSDF